MSQNATFGSTVWNTLGELSATDPSLVWISEIGAPSGLEPSEGERPGSVEIIVAPVADRAAAGVALGLALGGRKVIMELADSSRLPAVAEVLAEAGALGADPQRGDYRPCWVLRVPYGDEARSLDLPVGPWLHGQPGVTVVCAASPAHAAGLVRTAIGGGGVTVLLEPRNCEDQRGEPPRGPIPFRARVLREGRHVTLAAWGPTLGVAEAAAEALAAEGIEADVLDLVVLAPMDSETIAGRVRQTGRLVVVHPGDRALAGRVHEAALDGAFLYLEAPLAEATGHRDRVVAASRGAVHY